MVKQKQKHKIQNQNPLSNARQTNQNIADETNKSNDYGKRKQKREQLSKAEIKAQGLWHRKSNAGYSLFISYYGEQPRGICVISKEESQPIDEEIEVGVMNANEKDGFIPGEPIKKAVHAIGAGQSRAAKRRKRKKNQFIINGETDDQKKDHSNSNHLSNITTSNIQFSPFSSLLLQTFSKYPEYTKKYYHILPFLVALSKPLPLTFRFRFSDKSKDLDEKNLQHQKEFQETLRDEASINSLISPVSYDPNNFIYQAQPFTNESTHLSDTLAKVNLSEKSPLLKSLLMKYSLNGCIARQEIGSMLPVLALVGLNSFGSETSLAHSHLRILDMCASPGSKTLQALEQVAANRGRIVANDVHPLRLQSLKEAISRSGISPTHTSRIKYTNYDASQFPLPKSGRLFDAIMADVPCSGDGTIRKEVDYSKPHKNMILSSWTPGIGNALHSLQVKILIRALQLVSVGGTVCYSTCSLNPVEDEAVVAAAMIFMNGRGNRKGDKKAEKKSMYELVDFPKNILPGFIRQDGVYKWKVADYPYSSSAGTSQDSIKNAPDDSSAVDNENDDGSDVDMEEEDDDFGKLRWHESYEEARDVGMINIAKTLWPPSSEVSLPPLERCSRLFPQDQDTGGFFVALIRRIS